MCRLGRVVVKDRHVTVPLTGARYSVDVDDLAAQVTIAQRFENREATPIEAVYELTVDSKASVSAFTAEIDGKRLEGVIEEKERAKDQYDDAIASGQGAYRMEMAVKANTLSLSVGNLPPGKAVLVSVTYVKEIELGEDGKYRFVLPADESENNDDIRMHEPTIKGSYDDQVAPATLDILANFSMSHHVGNVTCSSEFPFKTSETVRNDSGRFTCMSRLEVPPNSKVEPGELLITFNLDASKAPFAFVQEHKGRKAVMLGFCPNTIADEGEDDDDLAANNEMIFVVDRSGSMSGSKMNQTKATLQFFLRSIPEGTYFNIISFGSDHSGLFKESKQYNEETFGAASSLCDRMSADMGGTELLPVLKDIFSQKLLPGIPRQVFIMTDGQVDNNAACISRTQEAARSVRVFTFGIGGDVDRNLCEGIAKAGGGNCEFVDGENMNSLVMKQLKLALKPALTDIRIDWGGLKVIQAPCVIPPFFLGARLIVYGMLEKGARDCSTKVTFSVTKAKKGEIKYSLPIDTSVLTPGSQAVKLAARACIKDIEDGNSNASESKAKEIMLSMSLDTGILSKLTAFIVTEPRDEPTTGEMALREGKVASVEKGFFGKVFGIFKRSNSPTRTTSPTRAIPSGIASPARTTSPTRSIPPSAPAIQSLPQGCFGGQAPGFGGFGGQAPAPAGFGAPAPAPSGFAAPPPPGFGGFGAPTSGGFPARAYSPPRAPGGLPPPPPPAASSSAATTCSLFAMNAIPSPVCCDLASGPVSKSSIAPPMRKMKEEAQEKKKKSLSPPRMRNVACEKEKREEKCDRAMAMPEMEESCKMMDNDEAIDDLCDSFSSSISSALPPPPPPAQPQQQQQQIMQSFPAPPPPSKQQPQEEMKRAAPAPSSGDLKTIIFAQLPNGSWNASSVPSSVSQHVSSPPSWLAVSADAQVASAWATALVIAILVKNFSAKKDEWELVVNKAKKWLKKVIQGHTPEELIESATKLV
eukprot:TRINITY_DN95_c0_g1_i1.p1 TRINITY_DN95_c0_g1~~TRINITY_DN95_c0_g1_i1.p1  ORF type:complete len:981 (+),score=353.03 TRINITY_DN95_c0_g1_i1:45-2987(+)